MYIKSIDDLQNSPYREQVTKAINKAIHKNEAEFCQFLPSHIVSTGDFLRDFTPDKGWDASSALSRYAPFETRLILQVIGSKTREDLVKTKDKIRVANRLLSRFIARELEKHEAKRKPFLTKIKKAFKKS